MKEDDESPSSVEPAKPGRLLGFLRRRAVYVVPLVVAAAVVVYVRREDAAHPRLPDYAVVVTGENGATLELRGGADASFEIVARPAAAPPAHVVAYAFAMGEGEPNPVDAKIEVAPDGSVRIEGRARALAGAREVRVVLGPAGDFKRYEDAMSRARDGASDAHVKVLVVPIVRAR